MGRQPVVSQDVVICFIAWAYSGNYQTEAVGISSQLIDAGYSMISPKTHRKGRLSDPYVPIPPSPPVGKYMRISSNPTPAATPRDQISDLSPNTTHFLLLNIQIYTFATIYHIEPLRSVAQRKIINHLRETDTFQFKLSDRRMSIIEPMYSVFEYAIDYLPKDDVLMDWLAKYASWKLSQFREYNKEKWDQLVQKRESKLAGLMIKFVEASTVGPFSTMK